MGVKKLGQSIKRWGRGIKKKKSRLESRKAENVVSERVGALTCIFEFARGNGIFGHFLALKGIYMGKILSTMLPKVLP